MIAIIPVGFITTPLISESLLIVKHQANFQTTWGTHSRGGGNLFTTSAAILR